MTNKSKRTWTDGLKNIKTPTNPLGGGRVKGRDYSYLNKYQGDLHQINHAYQRLKAQWRFRGESWDLTLDEFQQLWDGRWHRHGRRPNDLCLTRQDPQQSWTLANCQIISRRQHLQELGRQRRPKQHEDLEHFKATRAKQLGKV